MRRTWVKCICTVLCAIFLLVGACGGLPTLAYYGNVAPTDNFYDSAFCWQVTSRYQSELDDGFELWRNQTEYILSEYERGELAAYDEMYRPENSNFRFCFYNEDGEMLFNNVDYDSRWTEEVHYTRSYTIGKYYKGVLNEFTVKYGVVDPLTADDDYVTAKAMYEWTDASMPYVAEAAIGCLLLGIVLLILLMRVAGRRPGREDVVLNWHDKIPYDLYLAAAVAAVILLAISTYEGAYYLSWALDGAGVLWVGASILGLVIVVMAFLLTTTARIKARTIFQNTIIWHLCKLIGRTVKKLWMAAKRAIHTLPMVWRVVVLFLIYLLGTALSGITVILIPIYQGAVLFLLCGWALQWRKIREATESIVAGKTDVKIEIEKFYPDLKQHAEQLNDLGGAIDNAVDERMKSERFKTELITNVSHDLKTPLTSIINYVDLLKKEDIPNPTAQEYIEVLDRKSQRLKKLTEDLVEASKASTGAMAVNKERLDVVQLIRQATGEYEEKLTVAGLTLVLKLPEEPVYINADGRHVWRVLDNLLGNCAKYAMEGTRIYLDAVAWAGRAVITVKNISRNPLNVPPEQLVERFVRGDESRTTEGSGLGLSIARSLVELQGGQFSLDIDGDLFKAKILLPLA